MGLLEELADSLQNAGVGTLGTDLFIGQLPDKPDIALALYESPGQPPTYIHNDLAPVIEHRSVHVRVRGENVVGGYDASRLHIQRAYDAMVIMSGYLGVRPLQTPFSVARDENNRPYHVVNIIVTRRVEV